MLSFSCSKGFLLMLAVLIYLDGQGLVLQSILACAAHELGHWLFILLLGGKVRALRLTAVGAEIKLNTYYPLSYSREIAVSLAGPVVNLMLAAIAVWGGWHLFAGLNLCLGVLNLLPIDPLDGGCALKLALKGGNVRAADRIVEIISIVFSGALFGLGWMAWLSWGNITLLCIAAWLIVGVLK